MRPFAIAVLALASACTSVVPSENRSSEMVKSKQSPTEDGRDEVTTSPEPATAGVAAPVTCDAAETERLRQTVARTCPKSVNCAATVKTACGLRYFSAGPDQIGPDTLHRIASISKTYVGALMLMLENEHVLRLDDVVARWVDGVPNGDRITLRHLLTHRSGLFSQNDDLDMLAARSWRPQELLAIVRRHPPFFEPGEQFNYSNANFLVAGMVAEAATRQPLSRLIHARILEPLSLRHTFVLPDDSLGGFRLARAVDQNGADVTNLNDTSWAWGAGTIVATTSDVARWIENVSSTKFFDPSSQARLLDPSPTDIPNRTAGLGIFIDTSNVGPLVGHSGSVPGYSSNALYAAQHRATVVTFVDRSMGAEGNESIPLSNAVFGVLFPTGP